MKYVGYLVLTIGLLLVGYSAYDLFFKKKSIQHNLITETECNIEKKTFAASDDNMAGLIENGQEFDVEMNWYKCHPVEKGDVVLYRFSNTRDPVPRVIRAIPGEVFKLIRATNRWNVEIGGRILKAGDEPYFFGAEVSPVLSLYEKSSNGLLDSDTVLLFSNHPPGGFDSGIFGAVSIQDLIGKVDVKSVRKATGSAIHTEPSKPVPAETTDVKADPRSGYPTSKKK